MMSGDEGLRKRQHWYRERSTDAQIFQSSRSCSAQSEDGPAGDVRGPPIDIDAKFQPHQRAASLLAAVVLHVSDPLQLHMFRRRAPTSSRTRCLVSPAAAGSTAA